MFATKYRTIRRGYYYYIQKRMWWFPLWVTCFNDGNQGYHMAYVDRNEAIEYMIHRSKKRTVAEA